MQIGDIEGGDKAPDVVEAMADCFGYESMLGLKRRHPLNGLQIFDGFEDDSVFQIVMDELLGSNGYSKCRDAFVRKGNLRRKAF